MLSWLQLRLQLGMELPWQLATQLAMQLSMQLQKFTVAWHASPIGLVRCQCFGDMACPSSGPLRFPDSTDLTTKLRHLLAHSFSLDYLTAWLDAPEFDDCVL
eukprot:g10427.t1